MPPLTDSIKQKLEWEKPLALTRITLSVTGSFVKESSHYLAVRVCRIYVTAVFFLFLISALVNIFVAEDFFSECLESMHFLVTGTHLFAKYLTMQKNEEQFIKLFERIKGLWRSYTSQQQFLSLALSSANKVTALTFIFIGSVPIVNVAAAIVKNIFDPTVLHFPIQIWIPMALKKSFWLGSFVQVMIFYPPLICICMTTSFLNSITTHIEAIGMSLAREIGSHSDAIWTKEKAKYYYKKHQEVIGLVLTVNKLMAANWGFEMLCSSLQLTLPAYRTLRALKQNDVEVFNHAFILFLNFMVIYLIFVSGNRMLAMGEAINQSLYGTEWYSTALDERKNFLFALFRSILPVEYRYKIIHFDLPNFTKVVNTVFSYMALLQFLDNMGNTSTLVPE